MTAAQLLNEETIKVSYPDLGVLVEYAKECNAAYRAGTPIVSDTYYDMVVNEIARREPDHPYLQTVEPEDGSIEGDKVPLPARMLSTQKAYSRKAIEKWADDVIKAGAELGIADVMFWVTPKLDGFAAFEQGKKLFTRGDGRHGTDITRALDRGLATISHQSGPGEIVVDRSYFADHLADKYENSRNVIASVIKEGELNPEIRDAVNRTAVVFHPFAALDGWHVTKEALLGTLEVMWDEVANDMAYDTDGLVIEVLHPDIRAKMGSTNHHHRWQIAFKKNLEFHNIMVLDVHPQTSKTGRIIPVVELVPTKVSGVTISRATGHHYGNLIENGICRGATVRVCRSGLVIPYIESVVTPALSVRIPNKCPSCGALTYMDGDNLMCSNTPAECPAQVEGVIRHFFDTIGNCDGFGPSTIELLCKDGVENVNDIYRRASARAIVTGLGPKATANLWSEIMASMTRPIEDWRFLAAFSIPGIGKGGCEKLLQHHALKDVFSLTVEDVVKIDGFAEKTATTLVDTLAKIRPQFESLVDLFTLLPTPRGRSVDSPISGKTVVFSGTMQVGNRSDMQRGAKALGANVGSSVSSKTDYLVCGENVGKAKLDAALKHGVTVLTEQGYLALTEAKP